LEPEHIWNLTIILLTFFMKALYSGTTAFMTLKLYRLMESPRGHLSTVVTCLVVFRIEKQHFYNYSVSNEYD